MMTPLLSLLLWVFIVVIGTAAVLASGWLAFLITGRILQRETYNRDNAVELLRANRPEDWNALREADASWTPDLNGVQLKGLNLAGTNLRKVILKAADLTAACLDSADLTESVLAGATLANVSAKRALFDRADLRGANLEGADLHDASFDNAMLTGTIFQSRPPAPPPEPAILRAADASAVLRAVKRDPRLLHDLKPRQFEEVIAGLLESQGLRVELTARTGDGGKDIIAVQDSLLGRQIYFVEAKKYAPDRPVGIEVVRTLYGVTEMERATKGILATTSYFTKSAMDFAQGIGSRLQLVDYNNLVEWLKKVEDPTS